MSQGFIYSQGLVLPLAIASGGTGASSSAGALTNFGLTATATNINLLAGAAQTVVQHIYTETGVVATGTTAVNYNNVIPVNTAGNQYMSLSITPKSATNILVIDVVWNGAQSNASDILLVMLFQDSTANALACAGVFPSGASIFGQVGFKHTMVAGTTSATTFKVRAGCTTGATTTFNGEAGTQYFGGVIASSITITEMTP